jgi:hypothetical protein
MRFFSCQPFLLSSKIPQTSSAISPISPQFPFKVHIQNGHKNSSQAVNSPKNLHKKRKEFENEGKSSLKFNPRLVEEHTKTNEWQEFIQKKLGN